MLINQKYTFADIRSPCEGRVHAPQPINIEPHLKNVAIFSDLADKEIALIAKEVRELNYDKRGAIFHRGDPCTGLHIVVSGQVKLSYTSSQGTEKIAAVVQPGQSFGEAMLFLQQPWIVSAHAISNCVLLHVSKSAILGTIGRNHNVIRKLLNSLALQTHHLLQDIESYSLLTGKQRIIGYLLNQLESVDRDQGPHSMDFSISKCVLASRLNLTQEHFSRLLHELSELGLIRVTGRCLTIPSLKHLREHQFK